MYLIILIFSIIIISLGTKEMFTCNRNLYYTDKIFRPYRMIIPNHEPYSKDNIDNLITKDNINNALLNIKVLYTNKKIVEFSQSSYNYKKGFTGVQFSKKELDSANKLVSNLIIKNIHFLEIR